VRFCPSGSFCYWGGAELCWVWLGLVVTEVFFFFFCYRSIANFAFVAATSDARSSSSSNAASSAGSSSSLSSSYGKAAKSGAVSISSYDPRGELL
jgi:hypothetical protein